MSTISGSTASETEHGAEAAPVREDEYVLIPAYNEGTRIGTVISALRDHGYSNVVVVDDGSGDDTAIVAAQAGAKVIRHPINRGVGATTATGLAWLAARHAAVVYTCDADGQHDPADLDAVGEPIRVGQADFVIGSRMIDATGMPWARRLAQRAATFWTFVLFGQYATDTQSGLKALSGEAARAIRIRTNRFEFCSEMIAEIRRHKWRHTEVPIKVIYTDYSLSKGQSFSTGLKTLAGLIIERILRS